MSVGSIAARNALLTATIGNLRGSGLAAVYYLAHYAGNPTSGGAEITGGGYGRVAVPWTDSMWSAAASGLKETLAAIQTSISTGAWSAPATYIGFMSTASGAGDLYDYGALDASVTVSTANIVVQYGVGAIKIGQAA